MNIKIEPGKYYRLRNGLKYRCYATDGNRPYYPIHGAYFAKESGGWDVLSLTADGKNDATSYVTDFDIVDYWTDKPIINWANIAAWHNYVFQDYCGTWYATSGKPTKLPDRNNWGFRYIHTTDIPTEYAPIWAGSWRDSLTQRP
jgi:hypothetical protein